MATLITVLIIIAALLLIGVVLIQKPKGGGLASQFSSSNLAFGVKRTTDFIEKSTWGLAIAIIVLALASNFFKADGSESAQKKAINQEQVTDAPSTPVNTAPQPQQQPAEQPAEGGEAGAADAAPDAK
jgi:preprotein translocase subunit SecG